MKTPTSLWRLRDRLAASGWPMPPVGWFDRPLRHVWSDTVYLAPSIVVALASFTSVLVAITLSISAMVLWVGIPAAAATLVLAQGFAGFERRRLLAMSGIRIDVHYRQAHVGHGVLRWSFVRLRDPQRWLDALHSVVQLPVTMFTWTVTVAWWTAAVAGPTYLLWRRWVPEGGSGIGVGVGIGVDGGASWLANLLVGAAAIATLPWALRTAAWIHQALAGMLLATGSASALADRIALLEGSRAAAASAETQSLRRLERDIHDGPQQLLVRLAMDIGSAERALSRDPESARALLDSARTMANDALAELRALSRGIAPPVLAERGLRTAVESLAARALIPTNVTWAADVPRDAGMETTAYFVVAEALANASKHSHATTMRVDVEARDGRLSLTVSDDGTGGAHMSKGHGLAGLAERVAGAGGVFSVGDSPGGGTAVRAVLPCG